MTEQLTSEGIKIHGFYHVQIEESGKIVGDSGWLRNQVTNDGFNQYLVQLLGNMGGSKQISYVALGTGTVPGASDTTLQGEIQKRASVTAASSSTSKTLRFTATFSSANSFCTTTQNISNIGLFNTSSGGTLFAGNTYASSGCASNQNVNVTYDIIFS